jgi:predicted transcriptional regulator
MTPRKNQPLAAVLGPLEAEVMEVVWDRPEVRVRDVYEVLSERRPIAYTTVMTTMGRLAEKGLLRRIESHPAHRFRPGVSRDEYASSTVHSVLDWLVSHFPDPAVAYFLDRLESDDERLLDSLRAAIARRESGAEPTPGEPGKRE